MNAIEIEEAVSELASQPLDKAEFPYQFLEAFGRNVTAIKRLEALIHKVFASAQLDLGIQDRFGNPVRPREWFLAPLSVIDEAVDRIKDETIANFAYDLPTASIIKRTIGE